VLDLSVQIEGVDSMQRQLETVAKRAVPFAARETINTLAFEGRKIWQGEMRDALTLRNKWTERRALVERARGLRMSSMEATLGHSEPYMALLEDGKSERAAKRFRPIPTEHAAGQAKGSLSGGRKRAVRAANIITKLGSLKFKRSGRGRKADNARAVQTAIKTGGRLALLDLGRRKGIYRVMGSKRRPTIRKLYDLTRKVTPMPKVPTLARTLERVLVLGPSVAHDALLRQLQRAKVAGY
jgi:hypothetical protein